VDGRRQVSHLLQIDGDAPPLATPSEASSDLRT
jgi:hypothetical protein